MKIEISLNPVKRSSIRFRRYLEWYLGNKKYATKKERSLFTYPIFAHQTPLLRKLKDVDMWLQHNKINNLKVAAERLNGTVIAPGETLSYWRLIGNTTKRKGYLEGMILHYGK